VHRGRVRDAFLESARTAHTRSVRVGEVSWPVPVALTPEETRVHEQAVHWYRTLFGVREVTLHDHDLAHPTELADADLRLGGWVDLTVVGPDGRRELRQLDLWGRAAPADVLDDWGVGLALLRLTDWTGDAPLLVSWTDLLHGVRVEAEVDPVAAGARVRAALDERVARLRARAGTGEHQPGRDCGGCRFHKGCPAFPQALRLGGAMAQGSLLPGLLSITPSAVEAWSRCRRLWRDQHLLAIPPSDDATAGVHGTQVHDLLRLLHRNGPCDDPARIDEIVAAHGASGRVHSELSDHARRCPLGAQAYGHELTVARLHARWPSFVATARIDAAWIHDGVLDVRDYKTGGASTDRVADDWRARVQAWVMAPVAEARGLRLRVRYEQLAAEIVDDPEEWEPDAEDLAALDVAIREVVEAMRAESEWTGIADRPTCRTCRYRSICPDSAAPGAPAWPRVEPDPDEAGSG
jgi:hypothetical protein